MTTKWFVQKDGKQTGPYSLDQIQENFKKGRVSQGDYIRSENMTEWRIASEIIELSVIIPPGDSAAKNTTIDKKLNRKTLIIGGFLGLFLLIALVVVFNNKTKPENTELLSPQEEVASSNVPKEEEEEEIAEEAVAKENEDAPTAENEEASAIEQDSDSPADLQEKINSLDLKSEGAITIFSKDGISFSYPKALFGDATLEDKKGFPDNELAPIPDFRWIYFEHYLLINPYWKPEILIFTTDEYRSISEVARSEVDLLKAIIKNPEVTKDLRRLPFLPIINAAQIFHSNLKVFNFKNGTGIRYLTGFAQNHVPIVNEVLLYTYQGITNDGKYYISISIPVHHQDLPMKTKNFFESHGGDMQSFSANFEQEIQQSVIMLESSDPNYFYPIIEIFDNIVLSTSIQ